jgi:tetratricopeptide (TPR) repeat protein
MPHKRHPRRREIIDLTLVEFVVTDGQKIFHSPEVDRILGEANPLLRARDGQAAEKLFRQALELEPDKPDLLNNLAASLSLQGREAEALRLLEQLHRRDPDYLFARGGLAQDAMRRGDLRQAAERLEPLYERSEFHKSEYDSLCAAQISLLLLQGDRHSVQVWFNMWEDCDLDNPNLDFYRRLLE